VTRSLDIYTDAEPCDCGACADMCRANPGWPTPAEAALLLDAGHAYRMMLDWWEGDSPIYIVCPASDGYGGEKAPELGWFQTSKGPCVLLNAARTRCSIYGQPGRPIECRHARHDRTSPADRRIHHDVAMAWDTDEGRAVVRRWAQLTSEDPANG